MSQPCVEYDIVKGPCKEALFDNMRLLYEEGACREIYFVIAQVYFGASHDYKSGYSKLQAKNFAITGLSYEAHKNNTYNYVGNCEIDFQNGDGYRIYRIEGFYDTQVRNGKIRIFF